MGGCVGGCLGVWVCVGGCVGVWVGVCRCVCNLTVLPTAKFIEPL